MDYSGRERERLRRLDVPHVIGTVFLLSVVVAVLIAILCLVIWQVLRQFDLVDSAEGLIGKLAGGTFRIDELHLVLALLLLLGTMVVGLAAAAGVGAAVYNQVAETTGGLEFLAEDVVRKRDRGLVRALRRKSLRPSAQHGDRADPAFHEVEPLELPAAAIAAREAAATVAPPARLVAVATAHGDIGVTSCVDTRGSEHGVPEPVHGIDGRDLHGVAAISTDAAMFAISGDGRVADLRPQAGTGWSTCAADGEEDPDGAASLLDRTVLERSAFSVLVTRQGRVTRVRCADLLECRPHARVAQVGAGDSLIAVISTSGRDDLVLVTQDGRALRFAESDVPVRPAGAKGVRGIRLEGGDGVASIARVDPEGVLDLLTVTEHGYAKRTPVDRFRAQRRGGHGVQAATPSETSGKVVAAVTVVASDDVLVGSSRGLVRLAATDVRRQGTRSAGSCVVRLDADDSVVAATVMSNR